MESNRSTRPPIFVIKGRRVQAVYRRPECADYEGNPLEEALPPLLTDDQATLRLSYYPQYDDSQRKEPDHIRYLLIQNGLKFFAPLDIHIDLQRRMANLLRVGYAGRNPLAPGFWKELRCKLDSFDQYEDQYQKQPDRLPSTAAGFSIVGPSGGGKSFSLERVLSLTPQTIYHSNYYGQDFTHAQLVWLKLDCPFDGNPRGLCSQFFRAVDCIIGTKYTEQYVRDRRLQDELLFDMRTVASNHFLGVLLIDEIQRLSLAKSGGADKMLNFFVELINELGVPVVLVGNFKALSILSGDFSQMRRGTGQGDLIWDFMDKNDQWDLFIESLWRFQYTKKKCCPTDKAYRSLKDSPTLSDVLYEETQGITDFAVKVYMFAQERAIDSGKEMITGDIIRSAAKDKLRMPREVLQALKAKDIRVLERYEDLYCSLFKTYLHKQPVEIRAVGRINSAPEVQTLLEESHETTEQHLGLDSELTVVSKKASLISTGTPDKDAKVSTAGDQTNRPTRRPKGELPSIVASLEEKNGIAAYKALKDAGYIRSADEFVTGEIASS
jgi:hypothetical protein